MNDLSNDPMIFHQTLRWVQKSVYERSGLKLTKLIQESESTDYQACRFFLNELSVTSRVSKVTPTKTGQFVTLWKRDKNAVIQPHKEAEASDVYIINCFHAHEFGQFVFSKLILIEKGIISSQSKKGKLGFRVYPPWDKVNSEQAQKTQKWQLDFFIEIKEGKLPDLNRIQQLYAK